MAEIASWNNHSFVVSPTLIRGFTGLTIQGGSETEDKTSGGDKYVSRKNGNPSTITLVAELNAFVGCDVRNEALKFVDDAQAGSKGYFYMGGKKLIPCQLMLTEAVVSETSIAPDGTWLTARVKLTMKQCGSYSGAAGSTSSGGSISSGSSGSSGGSKQSVNTESFIQTSVNALVAGALSSVALNTANLKSAKETGTPTTSTNKNSVTQVKTAIASAKSAIAAAKTQSGLAHAQSLTDTAKKTSGSTKQLSAAGKAATGVAKVKVAME